MEVVGENGQVTGLKCLRAELGPPDASGRRRPQPVAESNFIMPAGAVISAISQRPDLACLGPWAQDASLCAKTVYADPATGQTSLGWLFAGGDAVTGPATVVEAVAAGKRSALAMDAYLTGKTLELALGFPHPRARVEPIIMSAEEKIRLRRPEIPKLDPVARATTFDQAELGLDDAMGLNEAKRCLRCDLCMGCGLCQTACAEVGVNALILADTKADRGVGVGLPPCGGQMHRLRFLRQRLPLRGHQVGGRRRQAQDHPGGHGAQGDGVGQVFPLRPALCPGGLFGPGGRTSGPAPQAPSPGAVHLSSVRPPKQRPPAMVRAFRQSEVITLIQCTLPPPRPFPAGASGIKSRRWLLMPMTWLAKGGGAL